MLNETPKLLVPNFVLVTPPTEEPVSVAEFQQHAKTPAGYEEDKITGFLTAARLNAEQFTGRAFCTQTWRCTFDALGYGLSAVSDFWYTDSPSRSNLRCMPSVIELQHPPLASVSSVTTYDDDDAATVMDPTWYRVSVNGTYGRLLLRAGRSWPTDLREVDSIVIDYTAGYGGADDVPRDIREAIIEWAAHMYENREGQQAANAGGAVVLNRGAFVPAGVQTKLGAYRLVKI